MSRAARGPTLSGRTAASARERRQRGSALVFVLWIALFISILAAGAAIAARGSIVEARVENAVMRERAALQSALEIAAWRIALQGRTGVLDLPRTVSVGDYTVDVRLAQTQGRVDINMADETAWLRVFAAAGAPEALARRLSDEVLDWRDSDMDARPQGAERLDYPGRPGKLIGDRAFSSVDELIEVRSMTAARLACVRPFLTAYGGTGAGQGAAAPDITRPESADGIRVALAAQIVSADAMPGRSLEGLVQYGLSDARSYDWVRFGGDDGAAPPCDPGAF
jgi:general secretion pathway protein K